jgi:hypothetical protein
MCKSLKWGDGPCLFLVMGSTINTMRNRLITLGAFVALILAAGIVGALENSPDTEDTGVPGFLEEGADLPPGLAQKDVLPPGLAKKIGDGVAPGQAKKSGSWTPPGQAKKGDDWLPPGLAQQEKVPPGHARRLGIEPTPSDDTGE